jgi:hypothetical protein
VIAAAEPDERPPLGYPGGTYRAYAEEMITELARVFHIAPKRGEAIRHRRRPPTAWRLLHGDLER